MFSLIIGHLTENTTCSYAIILTIKHTPNGYRSYIQSIKSTKSICLPLSSTKNNEYEKAIGAQVTFEYTQLQQAKRLGPAEKYSLPWIFCFWKNVPTHPFTYTRQQQAASRLRSNSRIYSHRRETRTCLFSSNCLATFNVTSLITRNTKCTQ